jgi:y4mF family transcriptional regulator
VYLLNFANKMTAEDLATAIKQQRERLSLSQQELADLAGAGIRTIYNLEKGIGNPTLAVMNRLAEVLGLELIIQPKKK